MNNQTKKKKHSMSNHTFVAGTKNSFPSSVVIDLEFRDTLIYEDIS